MPINNKLNDITNPVSGKFNKPVETCFYDHLGVIEVELLNAPSYKELETYIPQFVDATWNDFPRDNYSLGERCFLVDETLAGKTLPTALETIGLVFLISNIDLIDVTHLLRHRTMSFSAICSADRDMRYDDCLVKPSIAEDLSEVDSGTDWWKAGFYHRFTKIVTDAKQLYADMVDSGEISILDARTILPRCLEHHYYARVNLKDAIHFIKQRIDRQIQPESDNIIALKMWIEIVKKYPPIKKLIDLDATDAWYIETAPTGRNSNIYMPEKPRNDVFEYKEQWFMYKKQRSEMRGGQVFIQLWNELRKELEDL